ncbi:MAG: aminotransferase class V-fold PLP-dependent enzyme [Planctomycetota bacterium]|nr:aminotransferase class V-fold PLP-dependent enzyme [Planctomycetota bacterium]
MSTSKVHDLVAASPPKPLAGSSIQEWTLSRTMTFLNHGSFGARPRVVTEAQRSIKQQLDEDPADILWVRGGPLLKAATADLARFLNVEASDLVHVINATQAINAVFRSLDLQPGQTIVATNHGYNAVTQTLRYVTERAGARLHLIDLAPPLPDEQGLLDQIEAALDDTTALVLIDHVTSPTAMLFPVEEIVQCCHDRGVRVFVDGAHAPGMLPLDVTAVGADYYTGNLHKWVSAPLGAAFLHVKPEYQLEVHPTVVSHYLGEGFQEEFCWTGTCDTSAFLSAPAAIAWFESQFGWAAVRQHNADLVAWATGQLCEAWSVSPLEVPQSSRATSIRTIELPVSLRSSFQTVEDWRDWLRATHAIDVAVQDWADQWWIRLSAHIYNRPEDYERLIEVGLSFN